MRRLNKKIDIKRLECLGYGKALPCTEVRLTAEEREPRNGPQAAAARGFVAPLLKADADGHGLTGRRRFRVGRRRTFAGISSREVRRWNGSGRRRRRRSSTAMRKPGSSPCTGGGRGTPTGRCGCWQAVEPGVVESRETARRTLKYGVSCKRKRRVIPPEGGVRGAPCA